MDQTTIQTILQGGILVTVVYIALKTTGPVTKPPDNDTKETK